MNILGVKLYHFQLMKSLQKKKMSILTGRAHTQGHEARSSSRADFLHDDLPSLVDLVHPLSLLFGGWRRQHIHPVHRLQVEHVLVLAVGAGIRHLHMRHDDLAFRLPAALRGLGHVGDSEGGARTEESPGEA